VPRTHLSGDPGDVIAVPDVRALYDRFVAGIRGIHGEMEVRPARLESRILYRGSLVCRVIPYRELFHVQVGGEPVWETRIRDAAGCADTLDRILARFLELHTSRAGASS
jgi:hypothetical protein